MRFLFVKDELAWPRTSGHDVHTYYMMRAIQDLGHEIGLVTRHAPAADAIRGLNLVHASELTNAPPASNGIGNSYSLTWLQERYRSYWGTESRDLDAVRAAVQSCRPDVFVAVGLDALPYLASADGPVRIWYAADEWFLHHLSLIHPLRPSTWGFLKPAFIKLMYERAYASRVDRAWVVSTADRRSMQLAAGMRAVDVLPNGVDADFFQPTGVRVTPKSCVFWGRLDFDPNIQGLQWFCDEVWPMVRKREPSATLRILGFNPAPAVMELANRPGMSLSANVHDLRAEVTAQAVAVLPFVSGGGIKNKLLEAAALAMPILCTPRACTGLRSSERPFLVAQDPGAWANELIGLWSDDFRRTKLGTAARKWVVEHHSWLATGREAIEALESARQS